MAARRKTKKRATRKASPKKRSSSRRSARAAPAPAMVMASGCSSDDEKWVGLGLFFVGALILLNTWRGWVSWSVLVGAVLAVYGLYHYFRYG